MNWGVLSTKHGKFNFDPNEVIPKTVVVSRFANVHEIQFHNLSFRSHAGKVQDLVNTVLNGEYHVEPAGGSGYKTLRLINSTAGKHFKLLFEFLQ